MSAEIIQFIRGPENEPGQSDFPTIAFRSARRPDDLVMEHADAAPNELVRRQPTGSDDAQVSD